MGKPSKRELVSKTGFAPEEFLVGDSALGFRILFPRCSCAGPTYAGRSPTVMICSRPRNITGGAISLVQHEDLRHPRMLVRPTPIRSALNRIR